MAKKQAARKTVSHPRESLIIQAGVVLIVVMGLFLFGYAYQSFSAAVTP